MVVGVITTQSRTGVATMSLVLVYMLVRGKMGTVTRLVSLYLAVVIDLFSRRVVGWSLQPHMERSLVIDALEMAWQQRRPVPGALLFHSDRGSQYASQDFARLLGEHGITASMSRKGNCWDNACSETLFGSLKVEWLDGRRFATIREAKDAVLGWLRWYDRSRMHSTLDDSSPAEYEQRWTEKQHVAA